MRIVLIQTSGYTENMDETTQTPDALRAQVSRLMSDYGIGVTPQRVEVGQVLFSRPQHLSADQILARLRAAGSRVSKATVYNTLNLFSEKGMVRTLTVDGDRQIYDPTTTPHHHFYNVDTGELYDIPHDALVMQGLPEPPGGTTHDGVEIIVRVRNTG